jgi:ribosomal-protein-alanine N-acetyltransferase
MNCDIGTTAIGVPMLLMPQHGVDARPATRTDAALTGWRVRLPALRGTGVTLRELEAVDAASLHARLTTEQVARFISPPPTTVEAFENFIRWSHIRRAEGKYVCFGVVPDGSDVAIGLFQIQLTANEPAEWGFALGSEFWGTGLFVESAVALMDFAFNEMGLERLTARAAVNNGRGNGALRKIGAVRETRIPNGLVRSGGLHDQYYWTSSPEHRPRRKITWDLAAR